VNERLRTMANAILEWEDDGSECVECVECSQTYSLHPDYKPTALCDACAQSYAFNFAAGVLPLLAECDRLRARVAEMTRELAETATARDEAVDHAVKQRRLHATPKSARFTITADDLEAIVEAQEQER
jgi:hypothetical protein